MKKLKQIITQIRTEQNTPTQLNDLLWQFICYPPKMLLRLNQEQLLNEAEKFTLSVNDEYFAKHDLRFNGFKWGNGTRKVLITHGWGSKAADFADIILALRQIDNLQIIAFDAPGNGSSEGDLSNLLLFIEAVKAIITNYGNPDILIGHSLGAMANIIAMVENKIEPSVLISIAPLIRLKENFENSMTKIEILPNDQAEFLKSFEQKFNKPASFYNLNDWYTDNPQLKHWLAYDRNDQVSTYDYLKEFLDIHPSINSQVFDDAGHDKIIKSPELISAIVNVASIN